MFASTIRYANNGKVPHETFCTVIEERQVVGTWSLLAPGNTTPLPGACCSGPWADSLCALRETSIRSSSKAVKLFRELSIGMNVRFTSVPIDGIVVEAGALLVTITVDGEISGLRGGRICSITEEADFM